MLQSLYQVTRPNSGWQVKIFHQKWRSIFSFTVISYCCTFTLKHLKSGKSLAYSSLQKCGILCFISSLLSARNSWKTQTACAHRGILCQFQFSEDIHELQFYYKIMEARYKCLYYKQPLRGDGKLLSIISWSLCFSYLALSNYHLDDSSSLDLSLINMSFSGQSWTERVRLRL